MGFIGKIFKNKQIVTIVALILCFAILVFAYRYRVNKAINAVSVPVATRELKAREEIKADCFETKKVAQSMLTNNVITNTKELVGDENTPAKYVNYNTFIPEGGLFYRSAVTTWNNMPDSAWADIEEGNTIISLNVNSNTTYGNSIYPGDKIDLYYSNTIRNNNDSKVFIGPLIKGIEVLAVKDRDGRHIFKKGPDQKEAQELIFSVKDEDFLFLKRAFYISGSVIIPVPRNENYTINAKEQKGSEYIRSFINSNSKISKDDLASIKSNTSSNTKTNDTGTTTNENNTNQPKVVE